MIDRSFRGTRRCPQSRLRLPALIALAFATAGCVYRLNIQQGNYLDQATIEKVQENMTREQVLFLLGTPMIQDPFHAERWDYVYFFKPGKSRKVERRHFIVHFDGDVVVQLDRQTGY